MESQHNTINWLNILYIARQRKQKTRTKKQQKNSQVLFCRFVGNLFGHVGHCFVHLGFFI